MALPEHVPLAELLPEVLRHAGEGLADDGEQHGGWVLRRTDGAALTGAQGLSPQGVRDGEVLHLVPARAQLAGAGVRRRRRGDRRGRPPPRRRVDPARTPVVAAIWSRPALGLAVGLLAVLRAGPAGTPAMFAGAGRGGCCSPLAGVIASRAYGDARRRRGARRRTRCRTRSSAGALLVASGDPVGPVPGVAWIGAARTAGRLGGAAAARRARRRRGGRRPAGLRGAVSRSACSARSTALAGRADHRGRRRRRAASRVLVCGVGVLPLLAIRFGKLPMPPVTLPTGPRRPRGSPAAPAGHDAARERPDRAPVFAAVARTEEMLTGMLLGHAVLAAGAAVVLVAAGGLAGAGAGRGGRGGAAAAVAAVRDGAPAGAAARGGLAGVAVLGVDLARRRRRRRCCSPSAAVCCWRW